MFKPLYDFIPDLSAVFGGPHDAVCVGIFSDTLLANVGVKIQLGVTNRSLWGLQILFRNESK